jgi:hypothetical protein
MRKSQRRKKNFLCVYPLLVLRPGLDSSEDSKKVGQRIFRGENPKNDEVIEEESFMLFGM